MSTRLRSGGIILLAFLMVVLAGCVNKKQLVTIDTQKAQLDQAGGRIGELEAGIADQEKKQQKIQAALEKARIENQEITEAAAASKDVEEKNSKQIRSLNGQISALKNEAAAKEEAITAKESEIASFQTSQAALQEKVSEL